MRFDSFTAFIQMDGHGLYIWSAYVITLIVLSLNFWWPVMVRRQFIRSEKQAHRRQAGGQQESLTRETSQ